MDDFDDSLIGIRCIAIIGYHCEGGYNGEKQRVPGYRKE